MKNNFFSDQHSISSNIDNVYLKGFNEENIRKISQLRNEPSFLLEFRLKAFKHVLKSKPPKWTPHSYNLSLEEMLVFSSPRKNNDPEVRKQMENTFDRIGISLKERERLSKVALDAVLDSSSIYTSHQAELLEYGVIFCPFSEACIKYSDILEKYLGSVVNFDDNYFAAINAAVFSDGTFVYVPKNTFVPIDLSSYFRIDSLFTSQFERTIIFCDENSSVNYLEGCSAPASKVDRLHAAVVEIICQKNSKVNYFTLQNWFSGDEESKNGVYNFVTKRGLLEESSTLNWVQVEVGSSFTWKYPSCLLKGDNSKGTFYSISLSDKHMKVDTGTKMKHIGKNTKSGIYSKSIVLDSSFNVFRSLVKISPEAHNSTSYTCCDTYILGKSAKSLTLPTFNNSIPCNIFHEARLFNKDNEVCFFLKICGLSDCDINNILISNFTKNIIDMLPDEFHLEAKELLKIQNINTSNI